MSEHAIAAIKIKLFLSAAAALGLLAMLVAP
jgi:hypothetical protein